MRTLHPLGPSSMVLTLAMASFVGCATARDLDAGGAGGGGGEATGGAGQGGGGLGGLGGFGGNAATCAQTFEADAVVGLDASQAAALDGAPGSASTFVFDPPNGAYLPVGWSSPRFLVHTSVMPAAARLVVTLGELVADARVVPTSAPKAHDDSVVGGAWWTVELPTDVWEAARCLATDSAEEIPLTWSVRWAATLGAAPDGEASGGLTLLRDALSPDMTYWEITEDGAFSIQRLLVSSGQRQTLIESSGCIGCHASAAGDGTDFAVQASGGFGWKVDMLRPTEENGAIVAKPSPVVNVWARELFGATPGPSTVNAMVPTFVGSRWNDADGHFLAAVTTSDPDGPGLGRLVVAEVDAPLPSFALGPPANGANADGLPLAVAVPTLDPSGSRFVYTATDVMVDGYFAPAGWGGSADLWQVPVTLVKGQPIAFGEPSPLPFASGTPENETFPSFSPDGELLAFVRTAPGRGGYDDDTAEIWIMPADGGSAPLRIAGNDAPGSSEPSAPVFHGLGLTSSWPRFGEQIIETPQGTYYALLFSSRRGPADLWEARNQGSMPINGRPITHLWLAAVRRAPNGTLTTYPAVYVPGQRVDAGAHTASFVSVPNVPPPPPPN